MADDRALRDALEKVQGEVKALRAQLASADAPAELRERIEQLTAQRAQQRDQLAQSDAAAAQLQAQRTALQEELRAGEVELEALREQETRLVDLTVSSLETGPRRPGCLALLLLAASAGVLEALR
jgi:chromosome segregation ATPase